MEGHTSTSILATKKKLNSVSYCRGGNLGKEKEEGKFEGGSGLDLGEGECDQNTLYTSLKYSKLNKNTALKKDWG